MHYFCNTVDRHIGQIESYLLILKKVQCKEKRECFGETTQSKFCGNPPCVGKAKVPTGLKSLIH